jgi:hypothetical protein
MNDIKEKEQLLIVPLATLLLSRESGRTDGRSLFLYPPFFLEKAGDNKMNCFIGEHIHHGNFNCYDFFLNFIIFLSI